MIYQVFKVSLTCCSKINITYNVFHVGNMHTKHQRTVSFVLRQWVVTVFDRTTITEKLDPVKGPHLPEPNSQKEQG